MASPGNDQHVMIDITPSSGSVRMSNRDRQAHEEDDHHLSATRRPRSRSNSGGANNNNRSRSNSNSSANRRIKRDAESAVNDAIPLLETDTAPPRPQPPIAGSEFDDLDDGDDVDYTPNGGVDDGFFPQNGHNNHNNNNHNNNHNGNGNGLRPRIGEDDEEDINRRPATKPTNGDIPSRRGSLPREFPFAPEFGPGVITDINGQPRIIPDVNVYQQKKNLAQGMFDLALLSANANQLRYVLQAERHPYFYFSVVFISFSLILQVAVGIGLILNSRYNVKNQDDICKADKINNFTIIGIFLVTIINVFIASFGVADVPRATT